MGVRVEWVRYGRAGVGVLRERIAAIKGAEPLTPVTVVVPSNHVGVATRRLLASGALGPVCGHGVGVAAISFVTPYRLAELLGAPRLAGAGRRPVSTPVIAAALRGVLAASPGVFAPVAAHPATEAALVAAYRELRDVAPDGLDAVAATGRRAHDVVRLHRAAHSRLAPEWYDEQDLMAAAADALADPARVGDLGGVVVFLPQRVSRDAGAMLAALGTHADVTVLAGATGDEAADAEVLAGLRRIDPAVPAPPWVDPHAVVAAAHTRIVLASDADDETRAAVRAVVDAVRAGTSLDRIAVLHASPEPYARLAHEHLGAAGIATNGPSVVPLASRVAGRTLLDLMALPERGFRRQDVFAWLVSAPVRVDDRWVPTAAWERLSRDAGVVAGRADWDARLDHHAARLERRAAAVDPDDPEAPAWRAERDRAEAGRTRDLRRFVLGLIDDLDAAAAWPRRWAQHAGWARAHLDTLLGPATRRTTWPPAEAKAAERVEAALDRLAALDEVEGPVGLDVFARTLALELEHDLGRIGRFGEGVLVGPVSMGVGLDLDLVVVLGLAEGTFPAPVRDDSLLPDHERRAAAGELPLRGARVDRQHRELLAALASGADQWLGVPRGDLRRSNERVPSRWVLDVASALAGARWWADELLAADVPWVEPVASFAAGVRRVGFPATEQEHRLRALMAAAPATADALAARADDPAVARAAAVVAARRSDRFTRFDGNLAGLPVPSPVDRATSPTRLERWAACPFRYLLQDVLGVGEIENPEEALQITPLDLGSLVHDVLERFVVEVLARPEAQRPRPEEPWNAADRARIAAITDAVCDEYEARGVTGRPVFWHRDRARVQREVQRFLTEDEGVRRDERTTPIAAELAFGFDGGAVDVVPFPLPDGRALRFRGMADRIDRCDDGGLVVVDYKTGSVTPFTGLGEADPDKRGTKLQLAVYGEAARAFVDDPTAPVTARYWFVSDKGKWKRIGYPVTDAVRDRVQHVLGTIVAGVEAGVFCSHPRADNSTAPFVECPACDPDGLGVGELRRAWERKRADAALGAYVGLAEPHDGEGDATPATPGAVTGA